METIEEPFAPRSFGWAYSRKGAALPDGLEVGTLVKIVSVSPSHGMGIDHDRAEVVTADARTFTISRHALEMRRKYRFPGADRRLYSEKHPRIQKYLLWHAVDAADKIEAAKKELEYLKWIAIRSRPEHMVFTLDAKDKADDLGWDEADCPL